MTALLEGLGSEQAAQGSVAVNEKGRSSVDIDLGRLPHHLASVGIEGCVCCSQLSELVGAIDRFRQSGRTWTIIEQSPLSLTSDLRSSLIAKGHAVSVAFCLNPHKYDDAPLIQFQGIRDADVIVLTHINSPDDEKKGRAIVKEATSDLKRQPAVFVHDAHRSPFPREIWSAITERSGGKRSGPGSALGSALKGLLGVGKTPEVVQSAVLEMRERYSEISVEPTVTELNELIVRLNQLRAAGIPVVRAKGILSSGFDVDVDWVSGRYTATQRRSAPQTTPVLSMRSFDVQLRAKLPEIVRSLGVPESSPRYIDAVVASYPDRETLRARVREGTTAPLSFESDRVLVDLVRIAPVLADIPKEKIPQVGSALVRVLTAAMQTRVDLLQEISDQRRETPRNTEAQLNASYFLLTHLSRGTLAPFFRHPLLTCTVETARVLRPGPTFLSRASEAKKLRLEGRSDLTGVELAAIGVTVRAALDAGMIKNEHVQSFLSALKRSHDGDVRYQLDKMTNELTTTVK